MPTQLQSTHRHGRGRYSAATARTTNRSVPLRLSDVVGVGRRAGRLIHGLQADDRRAYLETSVISADYYKHARILWFEPNILGPASTTSARSSSSERRAPGGSKDELAVALRSHVGSWVAVREARIIASQNSPLEVVKFLRKNNLRADSVFRVPKDSGKDVLGEL
jgi:hypothetical protein